MWLTRGKISCHSSYELISNHSSDHWISNITKYLTRLCSTKPCDKITKLLWTFNICICTFTSEQASVTQTPSHPESHLTRTRHGLVSIGSRSPTTLCLLAFSSSSRTFWENCENDSYWHWYFCPYFEERRTPSFSVALNKSIDVTFVQKMRAMHFLQFYKCKIQIFILCSNNLVVVA